MANCGCTQGGCACIFEAPADGSITFTGSGSLADPYVFTAPNYTYIRPAARISQSGNQVVPPVTDTVVTFNTEEFDTDNMVNIAGAPTRITIVTAGLYMVGGQIRESASAGAIPSYAKIRKNGVLPYVSQDSMTDRVASQSSHIYTQCFESCIAGDYFELFSSQDSGGFNHIIDQMHLWAIRLGDNA